MSAEDEEFTIPEPSEEFVPAVFARSREQAEMYCELLNDHDIPATVGEVDDPDAAGGTRGRSMARGVPVLVPEVLLDEAGEVIAEREDAEGEFEMGEDELEDEDDDEFEELGEEFEPGSGREDDDYLVNLDDLDEDDEDEDDEDEDDEDEEEDEEDI